MIRITTALALLAMAETVMAQLGPAPPRRYVELTGTVMLEHGGHASEPMRIMLDCMGRVEMAALSGSEGRFRFRFDPYRHRDGICRVFAEKPGVESSKVSIPTIYPTEDVVDIGKIRISDGSPGMVSVTSAEAPKPARKKLERARKLRGRRDPPLERAAEELRAAVAEYEAYAEAWLALGGVLEELEQPVEALAAYGRAIEADPAYVPAYRPAIKLAHREDAAEKMRAWCGDGVRVDPTLRDACSATGRRE